MPGEFSLLCNVCCWPWEDQRWICYIFIHRCSHSSIGNVYPRIMIVAFFIQEEGELGTRSGNGWYGMVLVITPTVEKRNIGKWFLFRCDIFLWKTFYRVTGRTVSTPLEKGTVSTDRFYWVLKNCITCSLGQGRWSFSRKRWIYLWWWWPTCPAWLST